MAGHYVAIDTTQMKHISSRVAEAAIKFDLLSVDPKCQVCIVTDNLKLISKSYIISICVHYNRVFCSYRSSVAYGQVLI